MKDSSGDFGNTRTMLDAFAKDGFEVFVGSERFLLDNLRAGGVGCITATGNVNAAAIDRVYAGWQGADADRLQDGLNAVRGLVEKLPVIPAVKAIIAELTGDPGWATVRPPLVALPPEKRDPLLAELRARGFEMPGLRA
jgi:4-hydroxy-tetrahydrodipicolinate synthase